MWYRFQRCASLEGCQSERSLQNSTIYMSLRLFPREFFPRENRFFHENAIDTAEKYFFSFRFSIRFFEWICGTERTEKRGRGKKGKKSGEQPWRKIRAGCYAGGDSREFFSSRFGKFVSAEESENFGNNALCGATMLPVSFPTISRRKLIRPRG